MNGADRGNGDAAKRAARRAYVVLLAACGVGYFAFHAVRDRLPESGLRDSFPSFLTPLVMFAVVELTPPIQFRSRQIKFAVLAATTLVATAWLEGVVPRWTGRATGDASDAVAMGVGFAAFCLYDAAFGRSYAARAASNRSSDTEPA